MTRSARFTVSLEGELLDQLDRFLSLKGYSNRSQGIRNIVRSRFVQEEWERGDHPTVATVNLVYDHHKREILDRLATVQHDHLDLIVTSTHVHLDHDHCLEVLILRGRAGALRELGDKLVTTRGILHGTMSFSTTGKGVMEEGHAHGHAHEHGHPHPRARGRGRRDAR